jgi:septum formation protein
MLILASASPRRAQLLTAAGIRFEVQASDVDETPGPGEAPASCVERLAHAKADAVFRLRPDRLVLGADTTVVVEGRMLGKPEDASDARRMLEQLGGRAHEVLTGVALAGPGVATTAVASSRVWFRQMTSADIEAYLATGEWHDKAGGYAIQGRAAWFVDQLEGSYTNVVGLPVALVYDLLMRYPEGRGAVRSTP